MAHFLVRFGILFIFFILIIGARPEAGFATSDASVQVNSKFTDSGEGNSKPSTSQSSLLSYLGKFHLSVLHFPIVLVLLALSAEIFSIFSADVFWKRSTHYLVFLSLIFSLLASFLGWLRAKDIHTDDMAAIKNLFYHKYAAISLVIGLLFTFFVSELGRRGFIQGTLIKRLMLLSCGITVVVVGFYGGLFVFGNTYFQW